MQMTKWKVDFQGGKRARFVDAIASEDAAIAAAGKRARSAKHEATYETSVTGGGFEVFTVLMIDGSTRRAYVEIADSDK